MRKILFACTIGLIFMSIGFAALQKPNWDAPPEMKQKKNPVAPSDGGFARSQVHLCATNAPIATETPGREMALTP